MEINVEITKTTTTTATTGTNNTKINVKYSTEKTAKLQYSKH